MKFCTRLSMDFQKERSNEIAESLGFVLTYFVDTGEYQKTSDVKFFAGVVDESSH